jgi:hypothetical protein
MFNLKINTILALIFFILIPVCILRAADDEKKITERLDLSFIIYWEGTNPKMKLADLAAYCAPIFWYSPDEPELENKAGKDIRIPTMFPFEEQVDSPVVYYQVKDILISTAEPGEAQQLDENDPGNSIIDLSKIHGFDIDYNHYYRHEVGLGMHDHDTEQAQFKIYVRTVTKDREHPRYQLYLLQATAKAHALDWYDNIYMVNTDNLNFELELPFHILVEEGKHASCTDMNGDGYYTPGYDVNVRTNDAWGLRDVIRTGELFSAKFEAWMAKVRRPEYKVLPPLPADSPQRKKYVKNGVYSPDNAVYQLRPMPAPEKAEPDKGLIHDMSGYYSENWPEIKKITAVNKFFDWWEGGNFINSLAVAARVDNNQWGIVFNFPLFIVKNVEAPLVGGWLVNRLYFQDVNWRDVGYGILYTPSASRFMDPYFSVGVEWDKYDDPVTNSVQKRTDFVFETGLKFRGNVKFSPLKFLSVLTDFWGARVGIKNRGYMDIDELSYIFEIGAGVW